MSLQGCLTRAGFKACLNLTSRLNNRPKAIITAIKAIILHNFGVKVVLIAWALGFKV